MRNAFEAPWLISQPMFQYFQGSSKPRKAGHPGVKICFKRFKIVQAAKSSRVLVDFLLLPDAY